MTRKTGRARVDEASCSPSRPVGVTWRGGPNNYWRPGHLRDWFPMCSMPSQIAFTATASTLAVRTHQSPTAIGHVGMRPCLGRRELKMPNIRYIDWAT